MFEDVVEVEEAKIEVAQALIKKILRGQKKAIKEFQELYPEAIYSAFRAWMDSHPLDPIEPFIPPTNPSGSKAEYSKEDVELHYINEIRKYRASFQVGGHKFHKNANRLLLDLKHFPGQISEGDPPPPEQPPVSE